jgi:hypothetical protein
MYNNDMRDLRTLIVLWYATSRISRLLHALNSLCHRAGQIRHHDRLPTKLPLRETSFKFLTVRRSCMAAFPDTTSVLLGRATKVQHTLMHYYASATPMNVLLPTVPWQGGIIGWTSQSSPPPPPLPRNISK